MINTNRRHFVKGVVGVSAAMLGANLAVLPAQANEQQSEVENYIVETLINNCPTISEQDTEFLQAFSESFSEKVVDAYAAGKNIERSIIVGFSTSTNYLDYAAGKTLTLQHLAK